MTNRYKITFAYDGTKFAGFQKQPQQRTIEGVLTRVVNKMAKRADGEISVYGSGRTDAGVHALAQVAHFDFPFDIPADSMLKGLNSMCPLDIEVKDVEIVSNDFHARYDVTGKKYLYRISQGRFTDPSNEIIRRIGGCQLIFRLLIQQFRILWENMIFLHLLLLGLNLEVEFGRFLRLMQSTMRLMMRFNSSFMEMDSCIIKSELWLPFWLKLGWVNGQFMIFSVY